MGQLIVAQINSIGDKMDAAPWLRIHQPGPYLLVFCYLKNTTFTRFYFIETAHPDFSRPHSFGQETVGQFFW